MTDNRCPQCNSVVKGRQEVSSGIPKTSATSCPRCQAKIKLVLTSDDIGLFYHYTKS